MNAFRLDLAGGTAAIEALVGAAAMIDSDDPAPRRGTGLANRFASLTDIADDIDRFLRGLADARAALADASRSVGRGLNEIIDGAVNLDRDLTAALTADFSVRR